VVNVRFLDHGTHGVFYRTIGKLVVGVFIPDGLEVKVGSPKGSFEKRQTSCMRLGFSPIVECILKGCSE
jgi:hypothetical protein